MKIGIDISQAAFGGTGVASYTKRLVEALLKIDSKNEYILFFSSLRRKLKETGIVFQNKNVQVRAFKIPPTILEFLWNKLHIFPIEWFIGKVDVFLSSDWTFPPTREAKKVTTLHDLVVFKDSASLDLKITKVQRRRLNLVKKEADLIICDSKTTKSDAMELLKIEDNRLRVIYPGGS